MLATLRYDKAYLAILLDGLQLVRAIQDASSEDVALATVDPDPDDLRVRPGQARAAVVDHHLHIVGMLLVESSLQPAVTAPRAPERAGLRLRAIHLQPRRDDRQAEPVHLNLAQHLTAHPRHRQPDGHADDFLLALAHLALDGEPRLAIDVGEADELGILRQRYAHPHADRDEVVRWGVGLGGLIVVLHEVRLSEAVLPSNSRSFLRIGVNELAVMSPHRLVHL